MSELIWTPVKVRLGQIIKWEHNPRMSTKVQAQRLIKSERELGQIQTVAISPFDENGFCNLYDGHQRVSAWLTVKGADYEVNALQSNRHLTEDERKKVAVLLHTATGSWSWDALSSWSAADLKEWGMDKDTLKGWKEDTKELTDLLNSEESESVDAEPQIDRAEELLLKWQVKTGDLWQIGEHRLLCGDSTKREDVERLMGGERADMVFTDPPYNVDYSSLGLNKDKWGKIENDDMDEDDFYKWLLSVCFEINNVIKDGASIYLCHRDTDRKSIPFIDVFRELKWIRSSSIIWVKQAASMGWQDYRSQHEVLSYGWKKGDKYFTDDRSQTTVWEISRDSQSAYVHPTQKPLELFNKAIINSTKKNWILFEPFAGSGSQLVSAQNLSRRCYAIEISPAYCSVILERMSTAFPHLEIKRLNG